MIPDHDAINDPYDPVDSGDLPGDPPPAGDPPPIPPGPDPGQTPAGDNPVEEAKGEVPIWKKPVFWYIVAGVIVLFILWKKGKL